MIFSFDEIVKYLDRTYGLSEGDLIFTGTPKGVGPLRVGDVVSARICDVPAALEFSVKQSPK